MLKKLLQTFALCAMVMTIGACGINHDIQESIQTVETVVEQTERTFVNTKVAELKTMVESAKYVGMSDEDIDLISLVTMAEAEGECEMGKRLVIDTILNRVDSDRFPDSVHGVVYQSSQFTSMWNGRVDRCHVAEDIRKLVEEEVLSRTNSDVIFFRTGRYSDYGSPIFTVGNHYFSSYN